MRQAEAYTPSKCELQSIGYIALPDSDDGEYALLTSVGCHGSRRWRSNGGRTCKGWCGDKPRMKQQGGLDLPSYVLPKQRRHCCPGGSYTSITNPEGFPWIASLTLLHPGRHHEWASRRSRASRPSDHSYEMLLVRRRRKCEPYSEHTQEKSNRRPTTRAAPETLPECFPHPSQLSTPPSWCLIRPQ